MSVLTLPALQSKSLWSYNPIPGGCVLFLPLWALGGPIFNSIDSYGHHCGTQNDVTKASDGWEFGGVDGSISVPSTVTLFDFTSGAFSAVMGINIDDLTAIRCLISRGEATTDGWYWHIRNAGDCRLFTNQDGATQQTIADEGAVTTNTWYTVGFSRSGAAVTLYVDGVDVNATPGNHTNPLTAARDFSIGLRNNSSEDYDGTIAFVLVYNRALSTTEHLHIHNVMRWRY